MSRLNKLEAKFRIPLLEKRMNGDIKTLPHHKSRRIEFTTQEQIAETVEEEDMTVAIAEMRSWLCELIMYGCQHVT